MPARQYPSRSISAIIGPYFANSLAVSILKLFISFCLLIGCFSASAVESVVSLLAWKPGPDFPTYIIPQLPGESADTALNRYIEAVTQDSSLAQEIPVSWLKANSFERNLSPLSSKNPHRRVALFANRSEDMERTTPRLRFFIPRNTSLQLESVVIPVGAAARLNRDTQRVFHRAIGQYARKVLFLGGRDIAPIFYSPAPTFAIHYNFTADLLEINAAQDIYHYSDAELTGICRGHQLLWIALACAKGSCARPMFSQDLNIVSGRTLIHTKNQVVRMNMLPTKSGVGERLLKGLESGFKNDHHQMIVPDMTGTMFDLAAISDDGVVKAIVSHDGRVIGIQPHPERDDAEGNGEIFWRRWSKLPRIKQPACESALKGTS